MIKLVLLAIIVLSILGAIVFTIFSGFKPQAKPQTSVIAPQASVEFSLADIKVSDLNLKAPPEPIFGLLYAPKQTKASGYVRLSEIIGKILIQLKSDDTSDQAAFIYSGTCAGAGKIVYPLASLKSGKSQTIWETNMEAIQNQLPLSVKVFKDLKNLNTPTRCADLKMP